MNRKEFLKLTGVVTTGLITVPNIIFGKSKPPIILGQQNKKYILQTSWSKADAQKFPVNDCHEMVQDKSGRILLLTNETKNNVLLYDRSGKLLDAWGHEYPGAHGLTLHHENGTDFLYICDNQRHQVIKTTIDGKVLMTLDYPKEIENYKNAAQYVPTETAIADNGDIYVADGYGLDFIIQYNQKGEYIRHFGGRGTENHHLKNAHGICIDKRNPTAPVLIVTSREEQAFKRFTLEGKYIDTISLPGAWVCRPVIKGDYLYAAVLQSNSNQWDNSGFITILDKENKVVSNLGGSIPYYENGKLVEMYQTIKAFKYPHDVCIDADENIYVAQWNSGKVYPYKLTPMI